MERPWEHKVDARLRALLASHVEPERQVAVFVRFAGDRDSLESLGLTPGALAGDVTTGLIALRDVPRLAAAPAVSFVELTRTLSA